jgi:hypothetical protein
MLDEKSRIVGIGDIGMEETRQGTPFGDGADAGLEWSARSYHGCLWSSDISARYFDPTGLSRLHDRISARHGFKKANPHRRLGGLDQAMNLESR